MIAVAHHASRDATEQRDDHDPADTEVPVVDRRSAERNDESFEQQSAREEPRVGTQ